MELTGNKQQRVQGRIVLMCRAKTNDLKMSMILSVYCLV